MPRLFFLALLLFMAAPWARAERATDTEARVALVIGNASYKDSPLKNPVNDARAVAAKLRGLGFEVVERHNLTQKQIGRTLSEFRGKLTRGGTALFFYAGHGLQVGGVNYLPAVDADIGTEEDVPNQSINVDQVLRVMEGGKTGVNLVFLDACRNNPYSRSFRSAGEGLAKVSAPSGTLIFYATRPGSVAADGDGQNGLYTQNLLVAMEMPGLTVEQVQKRVAAGVKQRSNGRQEPWMEGLLDGDFYFKRGTPASVVPDPVRDERGLKPVAAPRETSVEDSYWSEVTRSDDTDSYAAYLSTYPNGLHVADANEYLERDKRNKEAKAKLKEDQAWRAAQNANTFAGFAAYLKAYPDGRYVPLARLKQKKLAPSVETGQVIKDCDECPEMVVIPAGSFRMGSDNGDSDEKPVHDVQVGAFALARTEVTQGQWRAIMGSNPSHFSSCGDNCPVEKVSWDDAKDYVRKLSQKTGQTYRLPSEAEWEYACRAGGQHQYCGSDSLDSVAWYNSNSGSSTHAAGQKQANAWGLLDMSGNVWEWVEDCWNGSYSGAPTDGSAWTSGDCGKRVVRGGSWYFKSAFARSANRDWNDSTYRSDDFGFRPARIVSP
jgi:formylglycine-generating enzyme required for sulfatase activity